MSALVGVARVAQVCAALLAVPVARRERGYRPVAIFLGAMTAASWVRVALAPLLVGAPRPRVGTARLVFELSDALFLAWPAGVAALAIVVFLRRRTWPVTVVWAALIGLLAGVYPWLQGAALARWTYGLSTLVACLVGVVAVVTWLRRSLSPGPEHLAALLVLASTGATLLGPYLGDVTARWDIARWIFLGLYLALSSIEAWQWIRSYSASHSPSRPPVLH